MSRRKELGLLVLADVGAGSYGTPIGFKFAWRPEEVAERLEQAMATVTPVSLGTEKHTRQEIRWLIGMQILLQSTFDSEQRYDELAAATENLINAAVLRKSYSDSDWSASWFAVEVQEAISQESREELSVYKSAIVHQYWMEID